MGKTEEFPSEKIPHPVYNAAMEIPTIRYLSEDGVLDSSFKNKVPDDSLIHILKVMILTRHLDERMITLQRQGTISFAMSSYGEEGCVAASAEALELRDWIYPQYREQACLFVRGYSVQSYLHHMFCNAKCSIHGRQMPNHFGSRDLNVVTVSSPIGTQLPHAAGCAYAMKLQREDAVALCYFGDGTTSEGDFHVALNFAAVRKAPAIFFCRNNGYAISTCVKSQFAGDGIAPRGIGYGVETFRVDGNDVVAVYDTVARARKHCLAGKGPVLIEAMTYRMGAHSTSDDPSQYRSDEEVKAWEKRCPIRRLRIHLEKRGLWDDKHQKAHEAEVEKLVTAAIQEAKQTPEPEWKTAIEDVYFEVPEELKLQLREVEQVLKQGAVTHV